MNVEKHKHLFLFSEHLHLFLFSEHLHLVYMYYL